MSWVCPNCGRAHPSPYYETPKGCSECAPLVGSRTPPGPEPDVQVSLGLLDGFATLLGYLAVATAALALVFFLALLGQPLQAFGVIVAGIVQVVVLLALSSVIRLLLLLEQRSRVRTAAPPDNA